MHAWPHMLPCACAHPHACVPRTCVLFWAWKVSCTKLCQPQALLGREGSLSLLLLPLLGKRQCKNRRDEGACVPPSWPEWASCMAPSLRWGGREAWSCSRASMAWPVCRHAKRSCPVGIHTPGNRQLIFRFLALPHIWRPANCHTRMCPNNQKTSWLMLMCTPETWKRNGQHYACQVTWLYVPLPAHVP